MPEVAADNNDLLDPDNFVFRKAVAFVNNTNENLFLTGKAGTGKTTFLKYIKTQTNKSCAVIAPTGVAAINAGGETIHSFLQLPLAPFVPGSAGGFGRQGEAQDKHSLLANQKLRETKIKLLRKLQLLIIDEVSMVRCDLLDAIDLVLRHVRKSYHLPFGGVQMIFIGDLFQLPPVAPENDWEILQRFYPSPYFFDAHVLRHTPPLYIELKKIYRQKDQIFIDILNRVRNGQVIQHDIDTLNRQYTATPQKETGYIILSTHNRMSDAINQEALQRLATPAHTFEGEIKNEFNPKNLPTDQALVLKEGAQVMFIKNDLKSPRRYFNGKIGTVATINTEGIWVSFADAPKEKLLIEKETWKNVRYRLNNEKGSIEEDEVGSFTQYPIRLAWAITVHKSQGLTLQKVVVDLGQSFASGQVYVALSRCTTLEGISLISKIHGGNIFVDNRVLEFSKLENDEDDLDELLAQGMRHAAAAAVCKIFSFRDLIAFIEQMHAELLKKKNGPPAPNKELHLKILKALYKAQETAETFHKLIYSLTSAGEDEKLAERKKAAVAYFCNQVLAPGTKWIDEHLLLMAADPKIAKLTKTWKSIDFQLKQKATELEKCAGE